MGTAVLPKIVVTYLPKIVEFLFLNVQNLKLNLIADHFDPQYTPIIIEWSKFMTKLSSNIMSKFFNTKYH